MKTMQQLLRANTASGRRRLDQVFRDWCELTALSFRNSIERRDAEVREARYLEVAGNYDREELDRFARLTAEVALELERQLSDVLGKLYMGLELGNSGIGQFFTPYDVSKLMAQMTAAPLVQALDDADFVRVHEPSSGSGGMIIALAEVLRDGGINYQRRIHVEAQDIERTAVHMSYIQLSLLHVPALVIHGNTLTQERFDVWPTPAHVLGGWTARLAEESGQASEPPSQGSTGAGSASSPLPAA